MKTKYLLILLALLVIVPFVKADTTFFDQGDALILANPPSNGTTNGTTTPNETLPEPATGQVTNWCITTWRCSPWSACVNETQTRTCAKLNETCYAAELKPAESQWCVIEVEEEGAENVTVVITEELVEREHLLLNDLVILDFCVIIFFVIMTVQRIRKGGDEKKRRHKK